MIELAKFTYSSLRKALKKKKKTIYDQGKREIYAIINQNKILAVLTNKENHKDNCQGIFEDLVKELLDKLKWLTYEINYDDLTYYFKGNTDSERFNDFNNGIELFKKHKTGECIWSKSKWNTKRKK